MTIVDLQTDSHALRTPFPHLQHCAYLDTAAVGLPWQGLGSAVGHFYGGVLSQGFDARPQWLEKTQKVRARMAGLLCASPADVTFVSSTTEGLNLAAHSINWQPGNRIVLAADEFPSVARAWAPAVRAGAEVVAVEVGVEQDREDILIAALAASTRVLAVSQTHWSTGTSLNLARLGARCRAQGVLLLVDGTQALGAVPTDLSGVDIYAAAFFKRMLSGFGLGVLVTSPQARAAMSPAFLGYANMEDPRQLQYAHVNIPAIYGLDATLDYFDGMGWPTVFRRVSQLGDHLVAGAARRGLDLLTPAGAQAGNFAFRCADAEAVRARLAARGISVAARAGCIRVSPHFYNIPSEIDQCLDALCETIPRP